jgi:hypothetical protein
MANRANVLYEEDEDEDSPFGGTTEKIRRNNKVSYQEKEKVKGKRKGKKSRKTKDREE